MTDERREFFRLVEGDDQDWTTHILRALQGVCELAEPLTLLGRTTNPRNLKTVTVDETIGKYTGLHVDSWDDDDLSRRHLSTNRICINIGKADRYFLFLPFSLMDMAQLLSQELGSGGTEGGHCTMLAYHFLERFPELPVIRCRLGPGEAYIAPTENLIHDGSSEGQIYQDELFTIRGCIRPLASSHRPAIDRSWARSGVWSR